MTTETRIAPQNSLLLVMDRDSGETPGSMNGGGIAATHSCIAVGTLCAADGETSVILTDDKSYIQEIPGLEQVFIGVLATPKKRVDICTVLLEPILKLPVSKTESHVEVWANHVTEPDRLCVLVTSQLAAK